MASAISGKRYIRKMVQLTGLLFVQPLTTAQTVTSIIQSIQAGLGLRRRATVTVPLPMAQARHRLTTALAQEIVLTGRFQVTRRYWGHLSQNHLTLHGPRAHKQFGFLTQGELHDGPLGPVFDNRGPQTELTLQIDLRALDFYQLLLAAGIILGFLVVTLKWGGLMVAPIFWGFLYGMTQWHFQHYGQEIVQLLTDLMTEETGQPR